MKTKSTVRLILTSTFFVMLLISCKKESRWDCFKGTGKPGTETRTLPQFSKLYLEGNVDVFIKQGNAYEATIEAGSNLIPLIKTEVKDNILYIDNENRCDWARSYKKGKINVYVTLPTLRFIWHFGSGLMQAADTITCDTLDIWAHQTGDVNLAVNAGIIYTNMHTTANITLKGKTKILACWHAGEGSLYCENLMANVSWIHSIASGNDHLNVRDNLAATIDWEADIFYSGNPVASVDGKGKGKLIKLD